MATTLEVAIVAGGSALLGAVVGGATQLLGLRIQWRNEQTSRWSDERHALYLEYIRFLLNLPVELEQAAIEDDQANWQRRIARAFNDLRAQLLLVASDYVRSLADELPSAYEQFVRRLRQLGDADMMLAPEDRQGVDSITLKAFRETFEPRVRDVVSAMRADLHLA